MLLLSFSVNTVSGRLADVAADIEWSGRKGLCATKMYLADTIDQKETFVVI